MYSTNEKKFVETKKALINELERRFYEEVEEIKKYASENLEYDRGSDFELMVEAAENRLYDDVKNEYYYCLGRVSETGLKEIFGSYLVNF